MSRRSGPLALAFTFSALVAVSAVAPPPAARNVALRGLSTPATSPPVAANVETVPVPLNQLVTRLLRATDQSRAEASWTITRDRPGWLFLTVTASLGPDQTIRLGVDVNDPAQAQLIMRGPARSLRGLTREEMIEVPAGRRTVRLWIEGGATADVVEVRAIPELRYDRYFPVRILDPDLADDDADFLRAHAMDHLTTITADWHWNAEALVDPWQARNRSWYTHAGNEYGSQQQLEAYYRTILPYPASIGIGVDIDEFGSLSEQQWQAWAAALTTVTAEFPHTPLALYIGTPFGEQFESQAAIDFASAMVGLGHDLLLEWYIPEQASESDLDTELDRLARALTEARRNISGLDDHSILVLGAASVAPIKYDIRPHVDFKVHLDRQFERLANDPAFAGLHGIGMWSSNYMDLESIRWMMALYRHYGIEGATTPLSVDPYQLQRVRNPDFEGSSGWTFASSGQIGLGYWWSIGEYEARWTGPSNLGDTYLYMTRGNGAPGTATQVLTGLEPGRIYALSYDTIWYEDLYDLYGPEYNYERDHPVHAELAGAIADPAGEVIIACESTWPSEGVWVNQHRLRFVPLAETVTLKLTDRETPPGETHFFNFVQVQRAFGK